MPAPTDFPPSNFPPTEDCPPIDLRKQYEVRYWSNRLGISPEQLRAVIADVGNRAADVQRHLSTVKAACLCAASKDNQVFSHRS